MYMVFVGGRRVGMHVFYKKFLTTSSLSSTHLGSIVIFASCVVGTCSILCG